MENFPCGGMLLRELTTKKPRELRRNGDGSTTRCLGRRTHQLYKGGNPTNFDGWRWRSCAAGDRVLTILVRWEIRRVMGMEAGDTGSAHELDEMFPEPCAQHDGCGQSLLRG